MKKIIFGIVFILASCGGQKTATGAAPLYQVLTQQSDGGANIRFYEILTEPKEIKMLKADPNLSSKISDQDLGASSFVILNMGEKSTGGYSITVNNVVETADKIIITVKETEPEAGGMVTQAFTYPYAVVKINSKKPIEIK